MHNLLFRTITPGIFRLLLACIVVIYHSVAFLTIGHYAVYVFFILSGYWIFKMYREKYSLYRNSYWVYLTSRLARLMPMYWLILLLSFIIYLNIPSMAQKLTLLKDQHTSIGLHNIFILGLADSAYQFIGTSWSLDIEVQFYILAPVLFFLCRKNIGLLLLAISSIATVLLVYYGYPKFNLLLYLPYFLIGALIYYFDYIAPRSLAVAGILAIVVILGLNYLIPDLRNNYLLNRDAYVFGFSYRESLNVLLTILTIPFVSVNVRLSTTKEVAGKEQLRSSMSYIIYLLHWPLLQIYAAYVANAGAMLKATSLVIYYVACLGLSYLIAKYIDSYFEKRRRRWLKGVKLATAAPTKSEISDIPVRS